MSQHSRNERNANSALVVNVTLEDLEPWGRFAGDPLAGVAFQRHWEHQAFAAGGGDYRAPAQWAVDLLADRSSETSSETDAVTSMGGVEASYQPGIRLTSLSSCLPDFVIGALKEALPAFDRRIPGYSGPGILITGVETRTSSPLRLNRDGETKESTNTPGLYPGGEGAGYAGGILSAAMDGIRLAEAMAISLLRPQLPAEPGESACDPA
jgi:uncharacterized FAD-dependent dehydrogenase